MVNSISVENLIEFENAFTGQSGIRVSVKDFEKEFDWKEVDCPLVQLEMGEEWMDPDLEAEIMKEIL